MISPLNRLQQLSGNDAVRARISFFLKELKADV